MKILSAVCRQYFFLVKRKDQGGKGEGNRLKSMKFFQRVRDNRPFLFLLEKKEEKMWLYSKISCKI